MTKAFIKHFLSLSILLLSVYGNLYAQSQQQITRYSVKESLVKSEQAGLSLVQFHQSQVLKSALSRREAENCKIVAAEIEEEKQEWLSFKKFLAHSNYFSTLFYALALSFGCFLLQKRLPSCKHSIYFSSYKWYILFRVIRI